MDDAHGQIRRQVGEYYSQKISEHGETPRGVDWNSAESQEKRFRELLRVADTGTPFTLIDYGCGYGAMLDFLRREGVACSYIGYDVSVAMIAAARARHPEGADHRFTSVPAALPGTDFVVASGIFNVKGAIADDDWRAYILDTLDHIDARSQRGFAFNVLTSYSDPDRMRPDLHYADPCVLFDHCKRHYSRQVALLHDYGLYEFTILVRKEMPT